MLIKYHVSYKKKEHILQALLHNITCPLLKKNCQMSSTHIGQSIWYDVLFTQFEAPPSTLWQTLNGGT